MNPTTYLSLIHCFVLIINCFAATPEKQYFNATVQNTFNSATESNNFAAHQMPAVTPDNLIRSLYKTHSGNNGAILRGKSRVLLDKYFDKNLADLIWKDLTTHRNEVGVIDFDIFYNAQDIKIRNLIVKLVRISGGEATVSVMFENYKEKNTLTYLLVKEKSTWKISDIDYGDNQTLLKYFKDGA